MSNNNNNQPQSAIKDNVPKQFKDSDIKTTMSSLKQKVETAMLAMKDLATLELFMPVSARMTDRLKSIKEMGSAKSIKIKGHWRTDPPKIHIINLQGIKINNDEVEIKFSVYESDKKGNKKLYQNTTEIIKENGDKVQRVTSAEYKLAYDVTEKIKSGKPITREIMRIDSL